MFNQVTLAAVARDSRRGASARALAFTSAAVVLVSLVGAGCGSRVNSTVRNNAANAYLRAPGSVSSQAPSTTNNNPSGPSNSVTNPGGSSATQPGANAPQSGQSANPSNPTQPGKTGHHSGSKPNPQHTTSTGGGGGGGGGCPTSGTDVGLTKDSITLGGVADISGPVAGLFAGAQEGLAAFQAYANSTGGICGRHVNIAVGDSGTNCSQNENATQDLVGKVFAFVGNFSLYDGTTCGGKVIAQNPTVPDISVAIDPSLETLKNHYDFASGAPGYPNGMFAHYRQQFGSKVQHVGTITESIPSVMAKQRVFIHSAESAGWKFVSENAASPTTSNFTSYFQTMCGRNHIQVFFTETVNAQYAATMLSNERSVAACKGVVNIIGIAYDSALLPDYQGDTNDLLVYGWTGYALFFNSDEAANIPEVALFQQWFHRANPGKTLNLYAMYVWAGCRMLQYAIEHGGPVLNRKTTLTSLNDLKNYDENGLISPTTPSSKTVGINCYLLFELRNSRFSRVDDPKTGYRCDGRFVPL